MLNILYIYIRIEINTHIQSNSSTNVLQYFYILRIYKSICLFEPWIHGHSPLIGHGFSPPTCDSEDADPKRIHSTHDPTVGITKRLTKKLTIHV
jgi:hypothetical protein